MLERKIIIGLITSTEYIRQIIDVWDDDYLTSQMARLLATWCVEYYKKYNKAPDKNIESIYFQKLNQGLDKNIAEEIEQDILPSLSDEYVDEKFNLNYLLDQTREYFKERKLHIHLELIQSLIDDNELLEAEQLAIDFKPLHTNAGEDIDLSDETTLARISKAFAEVAKPLFIYPKQLGTFLNRHLVRDGFIAFMASEKRGKSYWMLDMAIRARRQGCKVAFFQAGDMSEDQQLIRTCSYLTKKPIQDEDSGWQYQPLVDCVYNQTDECDKEERECNFGVFDGKETDEVKAEITMPDLVKAHKEFPEYKECHNCKEFRHKRWGVPWIQKVNRGNALTIHDAHKAVDKFFIKTKRNFKISTHPNNTLSTTRIEAILDNWEKSDDFVPDVIVVDYADILLYEGRLEFRHQQNEIWKSLRSMSQKKHCLMITATQADADSYEQNRLKLSNFSEDKRKYAHVTAMFGINQDKKDREKRIGLMRLNELVLRESAFSYTNEVTVLQSLAIGRPFIGSYL